MSLHIFTASMRLFGCLENVPSLTIQANRDYKMCIFRIKVHKTTRMHCLVKNGLRWRFSSDEALQLRMLTQVVLLTSEASTFSIFYKEQIKWKTRGTRACRHYEDEKKLGGLRLRRCNDCHRIHMEIYAVSKWLGRGRPSSAPRAKCRAMMGCRNIITAPDACASTLLLRFNKFSHWRQRLAEVKGKCLCTL